MALGDYARCRWKVEADANLHNDSWVPQKKPAQPSSFAFFLTGIFLLHIR